MKQFCISSQFCGPQTTSLVGSGLNLLPAELSKWAMPTMRVPLGIGIGFSRSNPSCQLKSHFALKIVSDLPDGKIETHFVVLAAQMHVRLEIDQLRVGRRRHLRHDLGIAVARRDGEVAGGGAVVREVAQPGRLLREDQTQLGPVGRLFADRGVVHAEDDVRSLRHELRRVEHAEILRAQSGIELAQQIGAFSLPVRFPRRPLRTPRPARHPSSSPTPAAGQSPACGEPPAALPGRRSAATTHMSSVKFALTRMLL